MKNKTLIYKKGEHYVDHIALGVSNTLEGIKYIENLTGIKPYIPEAQNNQWFKSAALGLGNNCFLEIIGPNPNHKKFHPFKQMLKELETPQLAFWYLGTNKFKECRQILSNNGIKIGQYNHIKKEIDDQLLDYEIGMIGKGFESESPSLIQWNEVPNNKNGIEHLCRFKKLELFSRNYSKLQSIFDILEVDMQVIEGNPKMRLTIDTPNGEVILNGGGFSFPAGIKSLFRILSLYKRSLTNK